ncbi:MAG: hypothetical protein UIG59_06505 [Acutalibacteraceae bacterium]|nr:hypothetical protein [Acutalibacteraceae bacterium]
MAVVLVEVNKKFSGTDSVPAATGNIRKIAGSGGSSQQAAQYANQTAPASSSASTSPAATSVKVSKTGLWPVVIAVGAVLAIGWVITRNNK